MNEAVQITDEQAKAILADPMATLVRWCDSGEYESFCALVTELLAAREGWQPIETAPRDGTAVDLWMSDPDRPAGYRIPSARWVQEGWEVGKNSGVEFFFDVATGIPRIRATHWCPLPTPPAIKETTNAA